MSTTAQSAAMARADRLGAAVRERELDALLVSAAVNVRYLSGYTGSNGAVLIGAGEDGERRFFTDFRYATQIQDEVPERYEREIVSGDLLEFAVRSLPGDGGRLGFDDAHLSVKRHGALTEQLPAGWELVPAAGAVEALREVKDADERQRIAAAAALVDEILAWIAERGLAGRTERQVAIDLEHEMRLRGAEGPSFPSIVAAGAHGARPHATPRDVEIPADTFVTIDLGAIVEGYCSDCTRTFATGELESEARDVYALVLEAQQAGVGAVAAGPTGREVDGVARAVIADAGYGEFFGHGLGHGVGLEIHEAPRLHKLSGDAALRAGNVVTVEPGIYLPGRFGVRIEDLVVVTDEGCDVLSHFSKDLLVVD
jgi:Xaa-Pro aminopeptidase